MRIEYNSNRDAGDILPARLTPKKKQGNVHTPVLGLLTQIQKASVVGGNVGVAHSV